MREAFSTLYDSALGVYVKASNIITDERGQDLIEYAILGALVAGMALAASNTIANVINGAFTTMGTQVNAAITSA